MTKKENEYLFVCTADSDYEDLNVLVLDENLYQALRATADKLLGYTDQPLDSVTSFVHSEAKFYPGAWITTIPDNLRVITKENFDKFHDKGGCEIADSIRLEYFCQDGTWCLDFVEPFTDMRYAWRGDMEIALDQFDAGIDPPTLKEKVKMREKTKRWLLTLAVEEMLFGDEKLGVFLKRFAEGEPAFQISISNGALVFVEGVPYDLLYSDIDDYYVGKYTDISETREYLESHLLVSDIPEDDAELEAQKQHLFDSAFMKPASYMLNESARLTVACPNCKDKPHQIKWLQLRPSPEDANQDYPVKSWQLITEKRAGEDFFYVAQKVMDGFSAEPQLSNNTYRCANCGLVSPGPSSTGASEFLLILTKE